MAEAGFIEDYVDPDTGEKKTVIHIKIHDWIFPDMGSIESAVRAESAVIKAFVKRFPEIFSSRYRDRYKQNPMRYGSHYWDRVEVTPHEFSGIKVQGVESDLMAIAGGVAPDVIYVNFRRSDTYIREGFLYPLDKPEDLYLAALTLEEKDFRMHPKIWPVIERMGPGGKHVWALPYAGALGRVLLYRKDLFDAAGIPYPDKNWTWEKMYQACRKLANPEKGVYAIQFSRGKDESWNWTTFLWSAGGEVMTYDEHMDKWNIAYDSPEGAVALDYYTRLCTEPWIDSNGKKRYGFAYKDSSDAYVKWQRGDIAMCMGYLDGKTFATTINPDLTGIAPVPIGPSGMRAAELNSRMMALYADIKEPAVRDAAWEFMRFVDSKEGVKIKTRVMVESGLGAFVHPRYLKMFGYEELIRLTPRGWKETFEIAIATGKPEPYGRHSNIAYNLMTEPLEAAAQLSFTGKLPKEKALRHKVLLQLLKKSGDKARHEMLGELPPKELKMRRFSALVFLLGIIVVFSRIFRKVIRDFNPSQTAEDKEKGWGLWKFRWAYLILLPALLTILLWQYVPLLRGSMMAFQDYHIMRGSRWVWLDNFGNVLWDAAWWRSVLNALRYSFLIVALTFLPPVILAILLQEVPRGKIIFRTLFYLPAVITGLVVILLWKSFYEPSESGVLNAILLRIPAIGFIALGLGLLWLCVAFAWRMWYHEMRLPCFLATGTGLILLYTCVVLTTPIFTFEFKTNTLLDIHQYYHILPLKLILCVISLSLLSVVAWRKKISWQVFSVSCFGIFCFLSIMFFLFSSPVFRECTRRLFATIPEPYRWLEDRRTAMAACVFPMVWAGIGPGCLIYLAALKGIADDFYEASDIDGATFIDKIIFIIFPILKPLLIINFVGVFVTSWFGASANILAMTGGAANTEVAGLHIFYKAFIFLKFGPATAMAWVLAFLLIGFTVYQLRILSRLEFKTTGD